MVCLDAIQKAAQEAKIKYIRMDGRTPSRERSEAVSAFQSDPEIRLAILSVTACGQGITLTAAADVVFAELHWTPSVLLQAVRDGRIPTIPTITARTPAATPRQQPPAPPASLLSALARRSALPCPFCTGGPSPPHRAEERGQHPLPRGASRTVGYLPTNEHSVMFLSYSQFPSGRQAKDTLDDVLWPLIARKLNRLGRALDGQVGRLQI